MHKINTLMLKNNEFTSVLCDIPNSPKKLFYVGKLPEKRLKSVAIVGSRKPTRYGLEVGYKVAFELAKKGLVVISGLALGMDAVAHKAALDAGGLTIAVLGNGLDTFYPTQNRGLAERILENNGVIFSEYEPSMPAMGYQFLERNRIVSGLADAVVVVEAARRSGTLSTAAHALAQGRTIFAVPGNITSPMSEGCNALLKQGATPLLEVNDVLEVVAPERMEQAELGVFGDNEIENEIIKLIRSGVRDGEFICAKMKLPVSEFNQAVTMMELKGQIRSLGANKWSLK